MKVYALIDTWVDGYAYNEYGTQPFHDDLVDIYDSREKAEKAAIEKGFTLEPRQYSNQDGKFCEIREIEVK